MYTLANLQQQLLSDDYLQNKRIKLADDLTELPKEIFEYALDVEILDLGNNQLSDLPDDFHRFKNLRILFLTNNRFEHIPPVIAQCENLEMIAFKSNQVKTVPENAFPKKTRWLILTENQIESLPDSMGDLTQLKKLALAGNQLTSLPESMANCTELELVRLSANQLTEIPSWLLQLPKLAWLAFSGNPISAPIKQAGSIPTSPLTALNLIEKIGEGASGVIHKAHCSETNEKVAVKLFKGEVTSDGYPKDEIHCCLQAGDHPNLIKVKSQIKAQDQLGLVMELIPGGYSNLGLPPSLETCTRDTFHENAKLTSTEVLKIAKQMLSAIKHMHDKQVSHGDIYAHNTMVNESYELLFGDFGAATDLSNLASNQKNFMQAIEVRAIGNMLDDLLNLCHKDTIYDALESIKNHCLLVDMAKRPNLADLYGMLAEL